MAKPTRHRGKWRIRWFDALGNRQSESYLERAVAVTMLRKHELEAEEIQKGLRPLQRIDKTFDELCDYWTANRTPLKRSAKDDLSIIRRSLRPVFGAMSVRDFEGELGQRAVDAFLVERHESLDAKTIANHVTLLISMLNLAVDLRWLDKAPRIRKPKVRLFNRDFRYLRTTADITKFLAAAREDSELAFVLYATAIYTGCREGELAALTWGDVDFDRRLITVQRSFDGPTKANDLRYVPLLDGLVEILEAWRTKNPTTLLFPNQAGAMHGKSARIFQETFKRVLDAAGFAKVRVKGKERHYVTFHSLRHTFASHWVMRGGDLYKLQRILGHKSVAMTQRYAHLSPDLYREDHGRLDVAPLAATA